MKPARKSNGNKSKNKKNWQLRVLIRSKAGISKSQVNKQENARPGNQNVSLTCSFIHIWWCKDCTVSWSILTADIFIHDTYSLSCSGRIVPGGHGKAMIPFGGGWIGANPWRTPFKLRSFTLFSWAPSTITTCIWKTNKQWMQGKVCVVYNWEGSTSHKH